MENKLTIDFNKNFKHNAMDSNNYSSNSYRNQEGMAMALKMLLAVLFVLFLLSAKNGFSQVDIISPSATVTACTSFPTSASPVGDVLIIETAPDDISTFGTLVLSAPTNFEFTSAGSVAFGASGDITSASAVLTNATTITVTILGANISAIDTLKIGAIMFRGINAATAASDVVNAGGTAVINGDVTGDIHASLTSTNTPTLVSTLSPPAVCTGTSFNYSPASAVVGATFAWTRAAVSGIANAASSGTGNPNENLYDTTASTINVTYVYTVSANGCTNTTAYSVVVPVNPLPTLSSALNPPAICSGIAFNYTPTSPVSGTTFYWSRAAVAGITNVSGSGSGNPNEVLTNATNQPISVTYVYALSANGCTNPNTYSVIVSVVPAPEAPQATAPTNITSNSLNANWTAVVGSISYFIDVSTSTSFSTFVSGYNNQNVGNVTTFNVTGLTTGSNTYFYRIRASNNCGTSLNSNTIFANPPVISAPTSLAISGASCDSAIAHWTLVNTAIGYLLDVSTDASFASYLGTYHEFTAGNVTNHTINGLIAGVTYYYRLKAFNSTDTSLYSNVTSFVHYNSGGTIALSVTDVTCDSAMAHWSMVTNATAYYLDVSTNLSFSSFVTGYNSLNVGLALSYHLGGLNANTAYYYRLRVQNTCGTSLNSNSINFSTGSPISPLATSADNFTCTSFNANWGAVLGATNYSIDVSTNTSFSNFLTGYNNSVVGNVTTYLITGLVPNVTYYYRVRASNNCGTSLNSNTVMVIGGAQAPIATAASNFTCTSVNTNWGVVVGATTYYLDLSTDINFTTFVTGYNNLNVGNVTTYNATGLTVNFTYYYRVRSNNGCGASINSNVIAFSTSGPSAPTALNPTNEGCSRFDANWSASSNATTYYLDVSFDPSFGAGNFVSGYQNLNVGNVTTYSVTGLTVNGATYYYRVTASNGCSTSGYSNSNTALPLGVTPVLTSSLSPISICSGSGANYTPTSSVAGTTFVWTITQTDATGASAGSGSLINHVLSGTGINAGTVVYRLTLTASGCSSSGIDSIIVTVNPEATLSSTLTPADIFTGNTFSYTPISNVMGATFAWSRAAVAGISNVVAAGTGNPSEILFDTTGSAVAVTYVYAVTANGCTNPTTYSVVVLVNTPAVWPGDANHDSIVNNNDLLALGLYYSQTGAPRASQGNVWQAYVANNWGSLQNNGEDLKHADCNGDGTIDDNDTLSINTNFNLTHAITPPVSSGFEDRATSDMYFVINGSAFAAGDWVPVEIWIGTSGAPINDLYGVSFNINYNASLVQSGTESITFSPSWLGTPGMDALKISKIDNMANTAYGAITRKDHMNMSGFGKVADFKFQIKSSISSADSMYLSFSNYMAIDSIGLTQSFTTSMDTIVITPSITGVKERSVENKLNVYPNPFNSFTTLSFDKELTNATVKIIDVLGKEVRSINVSGKQLIVEKNELNAGIYFVKVIAEQKIVAQQKIIIQ